MAYGIRAAIVIVRTYIRSHHLETPRQIIRRWAPPHENSTDQYISFVSKKAGLDAEKRLTINSKFDICRMLWAMAIYENGQEVDFKQFVEAWTLI